MKRIKRTEEEKKQRNRDRANAYYLANKEKCRRMMKERRVKVKAQDPDFGKRYRAQRLERARKWESEWIKNNPERVAAKKARHYQKNKEKIKARVAKYKAQHPQSNRLYTQRRKAKLRGVPIGDMNKIRKWDSSWRSRRSVTCFWCQRDFAPKNCHADHIVPMAKGGEHRVENLCVACSGCNMSKHAKKLDAWNKRLESPVLL